MAGMSGGKKKNEGERRKEEGTSHPLNLQVKGLFNGFQVSPAHGDLDFL